MHINSPKKSATPSTNTTPIGLPGPSVGKQDKDGRIVVCNEAPSPLGSLFSAGTPDLQSVLEDVFGAQSAQMIKDLFSFKNSLKNALPVIQEGRLFKFLKALKFEGEEGNYRVRFKIATNKELTNNYNEIVFYIKHILSSPELKTATEKIEFKDSLRQLGGIGVATLVVLGILIGLGLCGYFPFPMVLFVPAIICALGVLGAGILYHSSKSTCEQAARDTLDRPLEALGADLLVLMRDKYSMDDVLLDNFVSKYLHEKCLKVDFRAGLKKDHFSPLSPEQHVFKFKQFSLWQLLLSGGLQGQLSRAVQDHDARTCRRLLEPLKRIYDDNAAVDIALLAPTWSRTLEPVWFEAVKQGDPIVCQAFLDARVDVEALDSIGKSALHYAAAAGLDAMCRFLVEKGADVNVRDTSGKTPLHYAAAAGLQDMCQFLLDKGV